MRELTYFCGAMQKRRFDKVVLGWWIALIALLPTHTVAQDEWLTEEEEIATMEAQLPSCIDLVFYRYTKPAIENGEKIWTYLMPELPVYPPMKFKSERQRK